MLCAFPLQIVEAPGAAHRRDNGPKSDTKQKIKEGAGGKDVRVWLWTLEDFGAGPAACREDLRC